MFLRISTDKLSCKDGSKMFGAKVRNTKNSCLKQFYELNIYRVLIFNLYTDNKKHANDKNLPVNQEKNASTIASARIILPPTITI